MPDLCVEEGDDHNPFSENSESSGNDKKDDDLWETMWDAAAAGVSALQQQASSQPQQDQEEERSLTKFFGGSDRGGIVDPSRFADESRDLANAKAAWWTERRRESNQFPSQPHHPWGLPRVVRVFSESDPEIKRTLCSHCMKTGTLRRVVPYGECGRAFCSLDCARRSGHDFRRCPVAHAVFLALSFSEDEEKSE
jgi:hypothetical protein